MRGESCEYLKKGLSNVTEIQMQLTWKKYIPPSQFLTYLHKYVFLKKKGGKDNEDISRFQKENLIVTNSHHTVAQW